MTKHPRSVRVAAGAGLTALALATAACGSSHKSAAPATTTTVATAPTTTSASTTEPAPTTVPVPATAAPTTTAPTSTTTSTTVAPGTTTTSVATTACVNESVTGAVEAALVAADGRAGAAVHPGTIYYGVCGTTSYAVSAFIPSATATPSEAIQFMDGGGYPEYFVQESGGAWTKEGTSPGPPPPAGEKGCVTFTQLPAALRSLWRDCANDV